MQEAQIVTILKIEPPHADLTGLIEQLDAYLLNLYPPEEVFQIDLESPTVKDILFVIAYIQGKPVGCGALKPLDTQAVELKRFFVLSEYRNRGIAGAILQHLTETARSKQYGVMRLETGELQTEAVSFYKKHSFAVIDRYGEYVDCPTSLCMEKKLL